MIFGSTLLMKFMERWPVIITIGGALLGWVAGEMAVSDPAVKDWIDANAAWLHYALPVGGAVAVVAIGKWLASRSAEAAVTQPGVDLALAEDQHPQAPASPAELRFLVAADDSAASLHAVTRFIEQMPRYRAPISIDLLNVQAPVSRDVSSFVDEDALKGLHHEQGMQQLRAARELFEGAKVPCKVHIGVGDFAHVVAHYANTLQCAEVVLTETARSEGDRLGEVVAALAPHVTVPITVAR